MTSTPPKEHTYTGVTIYDKNQVYVPSVADDLAEDNLDHALVFRWLNGSWAHRPLPFGVAEVCVLTGKSPLVLCLGIQGEVNLLTDPGRPGEATELIDDTDAGPSELLQMKTIRQIGKLAYVAGFARRVYKRSTTGQWTAIDNGLFVPREQRSSASGFLGIDGTSQNDILAVGIKGEIWHFDGKVWAQEDSPTNLTLTRVLCTTDSQTYIAGLAGTVLHGNSGQWETMISDPELGDIFGLCEFQGRIYISSDVGVFVIEEDSASVVLSNQDDEATTCYLDANDGVMWSVGEKGIYSTVDGQNWTEIERPD